MASLRVEHTATLFLRQASCCWTVLGAQACVPTELHPPLGEEYPAGCRWLPQATVSTHPAIAPPVRTVPRQPSAVPVDSVVLSPQEGVQLAPPSTSAKDMGSGDGVPWGFQTKERLQLMTFCPGQSEIRLPLPWAE